MKLEQTADGSYTLYVPELDEHYHSVKGALTESQHIFIEMGLKHLIISLIYQTFFLLYGITGTCLYEIPTLVPYIIFATITEHYWYLNKKGVCRL